MSKESRIISDTYETLLDEGCESAANVIDACCTWADDGSLNKVKYWLKYGIENNGNYEKTHISRRENLVSVRSLKHAFELLEKNDCNFCL